MIDDPNTGQALDKMFRAAQENPVAPNADFVARLIADADANTPAQPKAASPAGNSLWTRLSRNWLPASGLTAATVLGLWIGVLLPNTQIAEAWLTDDGNDVDLTAFLPGADLSRFSDPEIDG